MLLRTLFSVFTATAAHCDTESGPVLTAAKAALTDGNVNHVLPWVGADDDAELSTAFQAARAPGASAAAVQQFRETLVRLHREFEGAKFDGIKPADTPQPLVVTEVDAALASGVFDAVAALIEPAKLDEVRAKYYDCLAAKPQDINDVGAGRVYVAKYVDFVHYALHHATAAGKAVH